MKILHTTDLHFNKRWYSWIEKNQEKVDVICITGDFFNTASDFIVQFSLFEQAYWIKEWFKKIYKPILICSGNHDIVEKSIASENHLPNKNIKEYDEGYLLKNIKNPNVYNDGSIVSLNGIIFGCIPYNCDSFDDYKKCNIILHHLPPKNTLTSMGEKEDLGSEEIKAAIISGKIKPQYILSGHIHDPKEKMITFLEIKISNPGFIRGQKKPCNIILSL